MMRRRGPGVIGTAVIVGGAAHMGAKSANKQAAASEQAQQAAYDQGMAAAQQQAPAAPPPAAPADDDAAEIQKYAALMGQGLITQEEFEAKKRQILGI
jgi:hypothetical protein